jgi:putative phosphoesterase
MRLGILSDTHNRLERTIQALALLQRVGAEALVHCGDLTGPEIVHACATLPCTYVFGNNDFRQADLNRAIAETGGVNLQDGGTIVLCGKRLAVTHGHLGSVYRRIVVEAPDYLLLGHTHIPQNERDGATRVINPGALHRAERHTVALLDLERDHVEFFTVQT